MSRFLVLICLGLAPLLGQDAPFSLVGQWVGERFLLSDPFSKTYLLSGTMPPELVEKAHQKREELGARPETPGRVSTIFGFQEMTRHGTSKIYQCQDRFCYTAYEDGEKGRRALLWSLLAPDGSRQGTWKAEVSLPLRDSTLLGSFGSVIFPLADGRYLFMSKKAFPGEDGKPRKTLFHILKRLDSGDLVQAESFPALQEGETDIAGFPDFLAFGDPFTVVGDALIVCDARHGMFWKINLEKGRLVRTVSVYSEVDEKAIRDNRLLNVVQYFQPLKDGDLLLAVREKRAVLEGYKVLAKVEPGVAGFEQEASRSGKDRSRYAEYSNRAEALRDQIYQEYPIPEWYRLNSDNLSIRHCESRPEGVEVALDSRKKAGRPWMPDLAEEGRLVYVDAWFKRPAPVPKPAPAAKDQAVPPPIR